MDPSLYTLSLTGPTTWQILLTNRATTLVNILVGMIELSHNDLKLVELYFTFSWP